MPLRPHLLSALFAFYTERSNARLAPLPKADIANRRPDSEPGIPEARALPSSEYGLASCKCPYLPNKPKRIGPPSLRHDLPNRPARREG